MAQSKEAVTTDLNENVLSVPRPKIQGSHNVLIWFTVIKTLNYILTSSFRLFRYLRLGHISLAETQINKAQMLTDLVQSRLS